MISRTDPCNKDMGKVRINSKPDLVGTVHCTHPPRNTSVFCGGGSGVAECLGADIVLNHNMSINRGGI